MAFPLQKADPLPAATALPSLERFMRLARQSNPGVPDQDLELYWRVNYGLIGAPETEPSDFAQGFKRSFAQVPELLYGAAGLAATSAEEIFGEGGISTAAKNFFARKFQEAQIENQPLAPRVEFADALESLRKGDTGDMADWLQDAAGYVVGQALQTAATGGLGALAGKALLATATERLLGGVVAKQAAKIAETEAARRGLGEAGVAALMPEATRIAAERTAQSIGAGVALQAQNLGMEAGDIFGGLIEQASKEGREITSDDLMRAWGAAAAAASTETATDLLALGVLSKFVPFGPKGMRGRGGLAGRAERAAAGVAVGMPVEGTQEYVQTWLEQFGAGQPTDTPQAERERINAAAVGALGGAVVGGAIGAATRPEANLLFANPANAATRIAEAKSVDEAIDIAYDEVGARALLQSAQAAAFQQQPLSGMPGIDFDPSVRQQLIQNREQAMSDLTQRMLPQMFRSLEQERAFEAAEAEAARRKEAELDALQAARPEPTAMELAFRRAEEERAAREAREAEEKRREEERARMEEARPKPEELPVLQRLSRSLPLDENETALVLERGYAKMRNGVPRITERGFRALQKLQRSKGEQDAQEVRSVEGQVPVAGNVGESRQAEGGENLQQPAQAERAAGIAQGEGPALQQNLIAGGTDLSAGAASALRAEAQRVTGAPPGTTGPQPEISRPVTEEQSARIPGTTSPAFAPSPAPQQNLIAGKPVDRIPLTTLRYLAQEGKPQVRRIAQQEIARREQAKSETGAARRQAAEQTKVLSDAESASAIRAEAQQVTGTQLPAAPPATGAASQAAPGQQSGISRPVTEEQAAPAASQTGPEIPLSRREAPLLTGEDTRLTALFKLLAGHDDSFRYPASEEKDIARIAADIDPKMRVGKDEVPVGGNYLAREVTMADGSPARIVRNPRRKWVWVEAPLLQQGRSGGSALYALATNWARNNGHLFIGDPAGISNAALYRRTEAMISAALKFGTTDFMEPHEDQLRRYSGSRNGKPFYWPGFRWKPGDTVYNLDQMLRATYHAIAHHVPEIRDVVYDPERDIFVHTGTGREYTEDDFRVLAQSPGARAAFAGSTTLERAALANTVLSGRIDEQGWRELLVGLVERAHQAPDRLKGRLSVQEAPPGEGLSISTVESVRAELGSEIGAERASSVKVVQALADLPKHLSDYALSQGATDVQAMYDPDTGEIWMVAENIEPGKAFAVLMHEGGVHKGLRGFIGEEAFAQLVSQIKAWARQGGNREENMLARRAVYRVPENTPENLIDEELLAYFIEEAVDAGHGRREARGPIAEWFARLWKAIRDALARLGTDPEKLTVDDVVALARGALERALGEGAARAQGVPAMSRALRLDALPGRHAAKDMREFAQLLMRSNRRLNRIISKINTPYHISRTIPEFAPVYEEGQAFLQDLSGFALSASDFAPDLLPRIEKLPDLRLAKTPDKADIEAAARALYAGTLYGGGSPMKGVVWTDDELRGKESPMRSLPQALKDNPLTDRQISLYRQALASVGYILDEHSKALVWRMARKHGISLSREAALNDLVRPASEQADRLIEELRDRERKELEERAEGYEGRVRSIRNRIEGLEKFKESVADLVAKTNALKERGYFPAMRFGQHAVYAERKEEDGSRTVLHFSLHDWEYQANRKAQELRRQYPNASVTQGIVNPEMHKLFSGLDPRSIEVFIDHLQEAMGTAIDSDPIMQEYFRLKAHEMSVYARSIHRKGVPGYSEDIPRVLANFILSYSRNISSIYHSPEMMRLVQDIGDGDVQAYATRLTLYLLDPQEESPAVRGFLSNYYILGSVASAAVNATQPIMMTVPALSQHTSWSEAVRLVARAAIDVLHGQSALNQEERAAMEQARKDGVVSPQEIFQLRAESRASIVSQSLVWRKLSFAWGAFFSLIEQWNRRLTFLAAYRLARSQGMKDAYGFARGIVDSTQIVYNRGNRPELSRGPIMSVVMTFKQFSIGYIELASRLYRLPDKRPFAIMMFTLFALAGISGMPFAEDLMDVIDSIGQKLGYATNTRKKLRAVVTDILGPSLADMILHGIPSAPGIPISVSQRLGMHNLIPGTALFKASDPDKTRDIIEILGPAAVIFDKLVIKGDLAASMPLAAQNIAKGMDMMLTGMYRDFKGRKIVDTGPGEAFVKMLGFQPASVARETRLEFERQQDIDLHRVMENSIAQQWALGIFERDRDKVAEAIETLRDWNGKNPELHIRIRSDQIARRVRSMMMERTERTARHAPPEIRPLLRREMAEAR